MSFMGSNVLANLSEEEVGDIISFLRNNPGASSFAGGAGAAGPPDPGQGLTLFTANCVPCHQEGGTGKAGLAPSIRHRDFLAIASDEFLIQTVAMGRPGTAMVARPDLGGASVDHIIAYLRSLPVANPVELTVDESRKAAGDLEAGRAKFENFCAACHGPYGEGYSAGGSGPGIGLPGFLEVASDDYILQTAKQGRVGTAMMPFVGSRGLANLEESDIDDIIVYLRSLNTQ
jgi:mono/diheme cytochrome c family protein